MAMYETGESWRRHIAPILAKRSGNPEELLAALDKLSYHEGRELFRYLQSFENDLDHANRTFRPFPGGPRIRM